MVACNKYLLVDENCVEFYVRSFYDSSIIKFTDNNGKKPKQVNAFRMQWSEHFAGSIGSWTSAFENDWNSIYSKQFIKFCFISNDLCLDFANYAKWK